jgi:hypothetical protein
MAKPDQEPVDPHIYEIAPELYDQTLESDRLLDAEKRRIVESKEAKESVHIDAQGQPLIPPGQEPTTLHVNDSAA